MKKIYSIILIFSIYILLQYDANSETLNVSISQTESYAVSHNISLQNSSLEIKKAEAQSWQALASMLPQISGSFDYQNYCGYKMELMGMSIPMNPVGTMGVTASVSVSGAQIVSAMLVDLAIDMADLTVKQNEQKIKSQVRQIYISILAMEKTLSLLDSNLINLNNLFSITDNAVKAGAAEQTSADQISIQVAAMKNTINSTKRSVEMLYNSLKLQMGTDVNTSILLTDNLEDILQVNEVQSLLNTKFDINNNYGYQLLLRNSELSDKQITLAKVNYLPSLRAFYQYSYKTYFGAEAGMNMTPPNLIGLSLSVPIYSSGITSNKIEEAEISKQIVDNNIIDTKNALLIQDQQLRYNLTTALEDFEHQKNNIDVSQRVFESILRKYKYGTATSMDVTTASTNLLTAHSTYIQSILNLCNAQIALEDLLNNKR
ncbi:MAG: TolC family protein [Bacteroidetes bacterium]|nr:TolC family protein [Bacteroidota bacterium]